MTFSVLIPSVPNRREMALALWDKVAAQAEGLPVEVLLLLDNKQRSIGKKREGLVRASRGDYVAFIDDDDDVADGYVREVVRAAEAKPDVIVFDSLCSIDDHPAVTVRHSLAFENEEYNPAGFRRKPWHINAWRGELARHFEFPDKNYGEDWAWCEQMLPFVHVEQRIEGPPLYHYRFRNWVTEAVE